MKMTRKRLSVTEDELRELYSIRELTQDKIAEHLGCTRQTVARLFYKYGIQARTCSERALVTYKDNPSKTSRPSREALEEETRTLSDCKIAEKYGVNRGNVAKWRKEYGIKTNWFKYSDRKTEIVATGESGLTPLEISRALNIPIGIVKRYIPLDQTIYSLDLVLSLISNMDMGNRGIVKTIKVGDPNLVTSIVYHTSDHILNSSKLTERIFRLVNKYTADKREACQHCSTPFKFKTFGTGYETKCPSCYPRTVSKISQELFSRISALSGRQSDCKYHENGGEVSVPFTYDELPLQFQKCNRSGAMSLDFVLDDRVIEFDGEYYHRDAKDYDDARDQLLKSRGYSVLHVNERDYYNDPEGVIARCLEFIAYR